VASLASCRSCDRFTVHRRMFNFNLNQLNWYGWDLRYLNSYRYIMHSSASFFGKKPRQAGVTSEWYMYAF
jgi:hypothetical protein